MGVASSRSQKKRYSPQDVENQRGRPPEVDRMAEKYRSKKDKNKVTDIRALPVAREAKPPRPPTREEVKANNKAAFETAMCLFDKVGAPFKFTDSMIHWISLIMSYFDLDFRKAAGLAAGFLKIHGYPFPDYSTLKKRSDILAAAGVLGAPPEDARVIARYVRVDVSDRIRRCAIDSTGLNLSKTTLWRMTKWKVGPKYRGWLKLHCLVDIDTNEIVAWVLTEEKFGDTVAFRSRHRRDIRRCRLPRGGELEGHRGARRRLRREISVEHRPEVQRLHGQRPCSRGMVLDAL